MGATCIHIYWVYLSRNGRTQYKNYIKYNHSVALLGRYWLIVIDDRELCVVMFICFVGSFFFHMFGTLSHIYGLRLIQPPNRLSRIMHNDKDLSIYNIYNTWEENTTGKVDFVVDFVQHTQYSIYLFAQSTRNNEKKLHSSRTNGRVQHKHKHRNIYIYLCSIVGSFSQTLHKNTIRVAPGIKIMFTER